MIFGSNRWLKREKKRSVNRKRHAIKQKSLTSTSPPTKHGIDEKTIKEKTNNTKQEDEKININEEEQEKKKQNTTRTIMHPPEIGIKSEQGQRWCMEDYHSDTQLRPGVYVYGVYDGHGGRIAAWFASRNLPGLLVKNDPKTAFQICENQFNDKYGDDSGTTVCLAVVEKDIIKFMHVGDSRAILCSNDKIRFVTSDHRPERVDERKRIEDLGGKVYHSGEVLRVEGILNVTRALGDLSLKKYVISEPEVTTVLRRKEDQYIVIASDGLFEKLTNEQVMTEIKDKYQDPHTTANHLVDVAIQRGSRDNITVVVICLSK